MAMMTANGVFNTTFCSSAHCAMGTHNQPKGLWKTGGPYGDRSAVPELWNLVSIK